MNLVELIAGCFIALMIVALGGWTFMDIALFSAGAILMSCYFFLLCIRKNKGKFLFLILAVVFLLLLAVRLPVLFPLRTRIHGGTFHNAALATVLQHISVQKQEWPLWRFEVYDEEAAKAKITARIPEDCTLQQALDCVAKAVRCDYDWCWHKSCGNEPVPGCATFRLRRPHAKISPMSDYYLFVEKDSVWQSESPK